MRELTFAGADINPCQEHLLGVFKNKMFILFKNFNTRVMRYTHYLLLVFSLYLSSCTEPSTNPLVTKVSILGEPNKRVYREGEPLDLTGLCAQLYYDNKEFEVVYYSDFADKGLICDPENGTILPVSDRSFKVKHVESGSYSSGRIVVYEPTVTDYDGNIYGVVWINNVLWMTENLAVTHFSDGTPIPAVLDNNNNGITDDEWAALPENAKAYCYYGDDADNSYGILYTWNAAVNGTTGSNNVPSNLQGVCPSGWYLPSDAEWYGFLNYLANTSTGRAAALRSTTGWLNDGNGTDIYGFKAFPSGYRDGYTGLFRNKGLSAEWWDSTEGKTISGTNYLGAYSYRLMYNGLLEAGGGYSGYKKNMGICVRCVRQRSLQ